MSEGHLHADALIVFPLFDLMISQQTAEDATVNMVEMNVPPQKATSSISHLDGLRLYSLIVRNGAQEHVLQTLKDCGFRQGQFSLDEKLERFLERDAACVYACSGEDKTVLLTTGIGAEKLAELVTELHQ